MNGSKIRDHYGAKWLTFILANTLFSEGKMLTIEVEASRILLLPQK
ncbi:protein of unknown function [Petrocella atlantisensis]|uniref:Uncharacterized protein n=1 Tax=Petrocella atlantisensis TaxID=2173034 RepID=A0A3P7PXH7_9FIRM|nr:hypothetical protein [Petrocella atlantisensis]VDN47901.1 protein of unknown function [Petrocella atlantisensis]